MPSKTPSKKPRARRAPDANAGRRDQLALVRKARSLERQIRKDARALTRDRLAADGALTALLALVARARGEEIWPSATIAEWRKDREQLRSELAASERRVREFNEAFETTERHLNALPTGETP